mgnify:CR=1 FL=1
MVNTKEFAQRLEKVFDYYELTATTFSESINVGKATISHILSGRNRPSLDFVLKTVDAFPEVELYWLLHGEGDFPAIEAPAKPVKPKKHERVNANMEETPIDKSPYDDTDLKPVSKYLNNAQPSKNNSDKKLVKIILFYEDGSFEDFTA